MKKVTVKLQPKRKMRDKRGRQWEGMNPEAAKANKFRKVKTIEVQKNLPKHVRRRTEHHEKIELEHMRRGISYKKAHKIALQEERKPLKGIKFVEKNMPVKKSKSQDAFKANIKTLVNDYKKTGKIGKSKPKSKKAATKQAVAIAYKVKRKGK